MRTISNPQKLLLTSPHHLGDFVAKVPFIRTFKQAFPNCKIILMARLYIKDLVDLIEEVDEFLDFEDFFLKSDGEIVENLKALNIDVLLHIPSIAHSYGPDVIGYGKLANIPHRIGNVCKSSLTLFKKKQFGLTHNVRRPRLMPHVHEFDWNLYPLAFFGISIPSSTTELLKTAPPFKEKHPACKSDCFNLVIHPGSHGNSKDWPASFFKALIETQKKGTHVILTGSKDEKYRFEELRELGGSTTDLRGEQSLKELIWLLSSADGLVGGSTGPIHIASLFQTKILGLFPAQGNLGPKVWGPKGIHADYIQSKVICTPCQKKLTQFNPGLCECMKNIKVQDVQTKINAWVENEDLVR